MHGSKDRQSAYSTFELDIPEKPKHSTPRKRRPSQSVRDEEDDPTESTKRHWTGNAGKVDRQHGISYSARDKSPFEHFDYHRWFALLVNPATLMVKILYTALYLLQWPFAIMMCCFACLYMYKWTCSIGGAVASSSIHSVCQLRYVNQLQFCKTTQPGANPYFEKVIEQDTELANIQRRASDHAAHPYMLLHSQFSMKDAMLQLAAMDLPNKATLRSFVRDVGKLAEAGIDDLQTSLAKTNALVDNVVISNNFARTKLLQIQDRSASVFAPLHRAAELIHIAAPAGVAEFEQTFMRYNKLLQDQASDVLAHFLKSRGTLTRLKDLVETTAIGFLEEGVGLEKAKLAHPWYWRKLMRSHSDKFRDLDEKAKFCAEFYSYLLQASGVVDVTTAELLKVRARVNAVKDELDSAAQMATLDGGTWSIDLTVQRISASIDYLDNASRASKEEQRKRIEEFELKIQQKRNPKGKSPAIDASRSKQ